MRSLHVWFHLTVKQKAYHRAQTKTISKGDGISTSYSIAHKHIAFQTQSPNPIHLHLSSDTSLAEPPKKGKLKSKTTAIKQSTNLKLWVFLLFFPLSPISPPLCCHLRTGMMKLFSASSKIQTAFSVLFITRHSQMGTLQITRVFSLYPRNHFTPSDRALMSLKSTQGFNKKTIPTISIVRLLTMDNCFQKSLIWWNLNTTLNLGN